MNDEFIQIIREIAPDAVEFAPSSVQQLQQLLFAPFKRKEMDKPKKGKSASNVKFTPAKSQQSGVWESSETADHEQGLDGEEISEEKDFEPAEEEDPMKIVRNVKKVDDYPAVRFFKVEKLPDYDYSHLNLSEKEEKSKFRMMEITGFGLPPVGYSDQGLPSVDTECLKLLLDGRLRKHFE